MTSIAIIAPAKFAFQDVACVELALRLDQDGRTELLLEPDGGEDARATAPGLGVQFEIQVKGSAEGVTLESIAACLAHFPSRTGEGSLFERLLKETKTVAVLIMSGRCDDAASIYTPSGDWFGDGHAKPATLEQTRALLGELGRVDPEGKDQGQLHSARKRHLETMALSDPGAARVALQRLIVLEQVSEVAIEDRLERHFRTKYGIPVDRVPDTLGRLRTAARQAKETRTDALPAVRELLRKSSPGSVRPRGYVPRGAEENWVADLSTNRSLLLSGPRHTGKSDAALWVAADFESKGYVIEQGSDVEQAQRQLLEPSSTQRVFVLDDPLGSSSPTHDSHRSLSQLQNLLSRLPPHRRLIVAQSQEVLFTVSGRSSLSACALAGRNWVDLATSDPTFLSTLWHNMATAADVPKQMRDALAAELASGRSVLEPGSIRHLASTHPKLDAGATIEELLRAARQSATDLGRTLAGESAAMGALLGHLAIGTCHPGQIPERALAFVSGAGGADLPGRVFNPGETRSPSGPTTYSSEPQLSAPLREALDHLERRTMVEANHGAFGFTRPYYRSAAESVLEHPTSLAAKRLLEGVERALFCLHRHTTQATARNLDWLFEVLSEQKEEQKALVDLAVRGLRSIFPTTRDACFAFLMRRLPGLPADRRGSLAGWADAVAGLELSDIVWVDGEARLDPSPYTDATSWLSEFADSPDSDDAIVLALNDPSVSYLTAESMSRALRRLRRRAEQLTVFGTMRLLSSDEGVLRAEAARCWMKIARKDDAEVVARIFEDDHPGVLGGALEGAIEGWASFDADRRNHLAERFAKVGAAPANAAIFERRLGLFQEDIEMDETPPWDLFASIVPAILKALPPNARVNESRLWTVTTAAAEVLSAEQVVSICGAWLDWLARELADGNLSTDYGLGVLPVLVRGTRTAPNLRASLVSRLLETQNTGVLLVSVKDLLTEWEVLTDSERRNLLALLRAKRVDEHWLRAVALTSPEIPDAVRMAVLATPELLDAGAERIIAELEPELLNAAISVQTGRPQPLWWLGVHHRGGVVWKSVVKEIAMRPRHSSFATALKNELLGGRDGELKRIVEAAARVDAEAVFRQMLSQRVTTEGDWLPETWETLLAAAADDATRDRWFDQMAEAAPCAMHGLGDLRRWLPRSCQDLLKRLTTDHLVLQLLQLLLQLRPNVPVGVSTQTIGTLTLLFQGNSPKLIGTCDVVRDVFRDLNVPLGELEPLLQKVRSAIIDGRDALEQKFTEEEPPPKNWLGL